MIHLSRFGFGYLFCIVFYSDDMWGLPNALSPNDLKE
jgi:hypothetical protein